MNQTEINSNNSQSLIEDVDYFLPSRVTIWWFMHHRTSGKSLLMDQMYKTYAEGMTEEKLIFKCVTGGKHHRSSLTFHFKKFQFSTNAIESLNRSIKYFLGLGFLDLNKLDSEMNRFHSQKLIEATDGLLKGRLNSKRR